MNVQRGDVVLLDYPYASGVARKFARLWWFRTTETTSV
jgi:hypothetical protein